MARLPSRATLRQWQAKLMAWSETPSSSPELGFLGQDLAWRLAEPRVNPFDGNETELDRHNGRMIRTLRQLKRDIPQEDAWWDQYRQLVVLDETFTTVLEEAVIAPSHLGIADVLFPGLIDDVFVKHFVGPGDYALGIADLLKLERVARRVRTAGFMRRAWAELAKKLFRDAMAKEDGDGDDNNVLPRVRHLEADCGQMIPTLDHHAVCPERQWCLWFNFGLQAAARCIVPSLYGHYLHATPKLCTPQYFGLRSTTDIPLPSHPSVCYWNRIAGPTAGFYANATHLFPATTELGLRHALKNSRHMPAILLSDADVLSKQIRQACECAGSERFTPLLLLGDQPGYLMSDVNTWKTIRPFFIVTLFRGDIPSFEHQLARKRVPGASSSHDTIAATHKEFVYAIATTNDYLTKQKELCDATWDAVMRMTEVSMVRDGTLGSYTVDLPFHAIEYIQQPQPTLPQPHMATLRLLIQRGTRPDGSPSLRIRTTLVALSWPIVLRHLAQCFANYTRQLTNNLPDHYYDGRQHWKYDPLSLWKSNLTDWSPMESVKSIASGLLLRTQMRESPEPLDRLVKRVMHAGGFPLYDIIMTVVLPCVRNQQQHTTATYQDKPHVLVRQFLSDLFAWMSEGDAAAKEVLWNTYPTMLISQPYQGLHRGIQYGNLPDLFVV